METKKQRVGSQEFARKRSDHISKKSSDAANADHDQPKRAQPPSFD